MENENQSRQYDLRVNSLSTESYAKFVVSEQGEELVFDSLGRTEVDGDLKHRTIVEQQTIEGKVLGGGDLYLSDNEFNLTGMSSDYGVVHQRILDKFLPLIIASYKARGIDVTGEAFGSDSVNRMTTPQRVRDYITFLESRV